MVLDQLAGHVAVVLKPEDPAGVQMVRQHGGAAVAHQGRQRAHVVPVAVGQDDGSYRAAAQLGDDALRLGTRVDHQALALMAHDVAVGLDGADLDDVDLHSGAPLSARAPPLPAGRGPGQHAAGTEDALPAQDVAQDLVDALGVAHLEEEAHLDDVVFVGDGLAAEDVDAGVC